MPPRQRPDQSFDDHQREVAEWLGCGSVQAMNAVHGPLHYALCAWLSVPSHSMADARGEPHDPTLAGLEEDAVLAVQRFMAHCGVGVPT